VEEARSLPGEPSALAGNADILAREASAEEINVAGADPSLGLSVFVSVASSHLSQSSGWWAFCDLTYVFIARDSWETDREQLPSPLVHLTLEGDIEPGPV
jgi:hypothetical protein